MQDKQSFIDLVNELYTENRESSLKRLVNELKTQRNFIDLFSNECNSNNDDELIIKEFINLLINLPHITSNIFQLLNHSIFMPENFFIIICSIIYESLKEVHKKLTQGQNQNLSLISQLIGQICFNKFEEIYWSKVGKKVFESSKSDLIWRKIGRRLVKQQNPLYLENLIKLLLLEADHFEQIEWYLNLNDNSTIKHLLTNKFLLINYFPIENQNLVENIVGYLINYNLELFKHTLHNVLSIWSNSTFVRHQTKDQHFYLCRILICCLKHMIKLKIKLDANEIQPLLLHSAETHLKMVEIEKRNPGLFVVEKMINYLNENDSKTKLDFEIEFKEETVFLFEILEDKKREVEKISEKNVVNNLEDLEPKYEYDTCTNIEDDLIPYDMSNDTLVLKSKKPIYLKDCMEGLLNVEDFEYNSTCLQCLSELIDKNRSQASELAVDFIRILLFLDNEDPELKECRSKTMVKLCILNPIDSAQYLTSQIYDRNLNTIRRLEILDVIVKSAKDLSALKQNQLIEETKVKSIQNIVRHEKADYEKIIEERLKSKTRILCSSHKFPLSSKNEFLSYVNYFFYPLINNFNKTDITLKFDEDDYFILGRLMITLAELLKSVSQTHVTGKLAITFIEFINAFRHHQESYVRKAITMCIHSILTNVPHYFLFEQLLPELLTFRDYLLDLKKIDPETFHTHGVLALYSLEKQINDYQNKIRINEKTKEFRLTPST